MAKYEMLYLLNNDLTEEAREAEIGIAGGNGEAILFKKGQIIRKIKEENIVNELINEIVNLDIEW